MPAEISDDKLNRLKVVAVEHGVTCAGWGCFWFIRELNYLTEVDGGYRLSEWPARVPDQVFFAITLLYRDRFRSGASGVEIPNLCHGSNSPGRLLNLSELRVREMLESLHRRGCLDIESRANLDQIRFNPELTALDVLAEYYARS